MDMNSAAILYNTQSQICANYQVPLNEQKNPSSPNESMEQPTDLSNSSNHNTSEDTVSEGSILDLSCKSTSFSLKTSNNPDTIQTMVSDIPAVYTTNLNTRKRRYTNNSDTLSSESDSGNINEHEERSPNILMMNNNNTTQVPSYLPMNVPIAVPIPPTSTILSSLLTSNPFEPNRNNIINTNIQLSTIATPTIPPINLYNHENSKTMPRPFKAYTLNAPPNSINSAFSLNSDKSFAKFREQVLMSVKHQKESSNPKMRRPKKTSSSAVPTSTVEEKDAVYLEKRRRNNEAAKRSRDARRAKEDEIAIKAAYLEQENMTLKINLDVLREECKRLASIVNKYNGA
ncbi:PREDICTED: hepatic leukemia factor [Polistes dominula]|uniref:Hepatic leukemia factor n=1 Tax=Polistes dominula TaxID=743375 RepID=A0ABM1I1N0_POLDO|nr:PREDICTED: hepatic leukemia factor [Polistes dominula]